MNASRLPSHGRQLLAFLTLTLAACSGPNLIPGARPDLLEFLRPGHTTREEVVLQLGQPSSTLTNEAILTYRIGELEKQGLFVVGSRANPAWQWDAVRYSLVLVFDEAGVLKRHNLVNVK